MAGSIGRQYSESEKLSRTATLALAKLPMAAIGATMALTADDRAAERKAAKEENMDVALRDSTTAYSHQVKRLPGPRASDAGCGPPSDWPEDGSSNILRPP